MVLGMNDHFYCVPCTDKLIAADEAAIRAENERYKQEAPSRELAQKIGASAIGERFKGMTFADYKPTCEKAVKVFSECQSYVENFKNDSGCNVLMIGSPGTGKNMLAAIIGQEIIKRNSSFFHTTAMKLVRRIKSTWKNNDEDEQKVIDSFVSPSLLVIDEIGVQFGSATEQLFLTEVINERYEKRRPTILISNLKLSQLTEVMGERVVDRFYDDGSKLLVFDWQSYRRNKP
jgi:DNA replication protein DnaC